MSRSATTSLMSRLCSRWRASLTPCMRLTLCRGGRCSASDRRRWRGWSEAECRASRSARSCARQCNSFARTQCHTYILKTLRRDLSHCVGEGLAVRATKKRNRPAHSEPKRCTLISCVPLSRRAGERENSGRANSHSPLHPSPTLWERGWG